MSIPFGLPLGADQIVGRRTHWARAGGEWSIPDYAIFGDPISCSHNFFNQNVPEEFMDCTAPWSGAEFYAVAEYCVRISRGDNRGDVNVPGGDGEITPADVVFLLNYLFRGGSAPVPYNQGDTNCDGTVTARDIVRLIGYLFRGEPVPRCCDP
jgi:hypothetical protein